MEKTIKINLEDGTFDVEIHGLSLSRISNLSTLPEDVAENLKRTLRTLGGNPDMIEAGVSRLLQGKSDIYSILRAIL